VAHVAVECHKCLAGDENKFAFAAEAATRLTRRADFN
jgi:hypothetical protein